MHLLLSLNTCALWKPLEDQLHFRVGGAGVPAHVGLLREAQPTDRAGEGPLPCVGVHVVFKVVTLAKQPLTNRAWVAQACPSSSALQEKPRPHSLILQPTTTITTTITATPCCSTWTTESHHYHCLCLYTKAVWTVTWLIICQLCTDAAVFTLHFLKPK